MREGTATGAELVEAAIERVERLDGDLHAVIHRRFDEALAELPSASGPFAGVPILLKDLGPGGQVDGTPYHRGNHALREAGYVHRRGDSHVVRRLRAAGFIVIGKTNTPELGFSTTTEPVAYGPTHNPWDLERSPAGSSGGSAAAVAAGMAPVAHASDGGGSIRMPAAVCGLVGLKVSRGRISAGPHLAGGGRSVDGCVTRTVRDTAAILDVLAGPEPGDPVVTPAPARPFAQELGVAPGALRIGCSSASPVDTPVDDGCVTAVHAAAGALERLGHHVDEASPPALLEPDFGFAGILPIHAASIASAVDGVGRDLDRPVTADDFEPAVWQQAELGRSFNGPQVVAAEECIVAWTRRMAGWWRDFDLLVTPTVAQPAPKLGELAGEDSAMRSLTFSPFCAAWNWTGQPAISLPLHVSPDGLPIGVMLVAAWGREDLLLRVAAQLEVALPWSGRRPTW